MKMEEVCGRGKIVVGSGKGVGKGRPLWEVEGEERLLCKNEEVCGKEKTFVGKGRGTWEREDFVGNGRGVETEDFFVWKMKEASRKWNMCARNGKSGRKKRRVKGRVGHGRCFARNGRGGKMEEACRKGKMCERNGSCVG